MTAPQGNQQQAAPAQPAPQPPTQQPVQGQPADQGQQQPGQGQQQQQVPNPWAGLLDVAPQQGQGQQQPGQGQQVQFPQQLGQFGQQQGLFPMGYPQQGVPQMDPTQIAAIVQSAVDRRVNQLTNPQWQQAHGQLPQGQPGQFQPAPPQYQPPPVPSGPSDADLREARMAATAYLGDQIQFGSPDERAMAVDLASAQIHNQLLLGMTPNQAGLAAAQAVAARVTNLRRSYEDQAVRALRQRGLLNETPQAPAGMAGSVGFPQGGTPVTTANQQQTVAKHNKLQQWAQEENAARGWPTKPANA